jgi:metallo-beta-lactamase class B
MSDPRLIGRRAFCACCTGLALWPLAARAAALAPADDGLPQALELGMPGMQRIARTVWVAELAPGIWLHSTTGLIDGSSYYPANGLVIEREGGSILIDTGYDPDQAAILLDWSARTLKAPIAKAVATHFHRDRTGGIAGLDHRGVPTFAHPLTYELTTTHAAPVPRPLRDFREAAYALDPEVELYFPGAGHTWDNIAVWLPRHQLLYGGCFLKSETSGNLGNIADADLDAWSGSLQALSRRYPERKSVIPGHGTISGDAIAHTALLLSKPKS